MLQKSACHRVLVTHASLGALGASVKALIPADFALSIDEVPTMAQCYPYLGHETPVHEFEPYPAPRVQQNMDDVALYIHSSGSTGFPKPIPHTNRSILGWCSLGMLSSCCSRAIINRLHYRRTDLIVDLRYSPRMGMMHFPPFHLIGVVAQILVPLAAVTCVALYPPTSFADPAAATIIPTSDNIMEHCKRTNVTAVLAVPTFLEAWVSEPESVQWLRSLQFIVRPRKLVRLDPSSLLIALTSQAYGGGPLAVKVGDSLVRDGVNLCALYGATEFGLPTALYAGAEERAPEDWCYMRFSEKASVRWVPQADGTFESQFLVRNIGGLIPPIPPLISCARIPMCTESACATCRMRGATPAMTAGSPTRRSLVSGACTLFPSMISGAGF